MSFALFSEDIILSNYINNIVPCTVDLYHLQEDETYECGLKVMDFVLKTNFTSLRSQKLLFFVTAAETDENNREENIYLEILGERKRDEANNRFPK